MKRVQVLILALITMLFVETVLANPPDTELKIVFVAKTDIAAGELLTAQQLRIERWPSDRVPQQAVSSFEDLDDRFVRTKIYAGEPILEQKLFGESTTTERIPAGHRAVSIRFDSPGYAGLVAPGDRVDVLAFTLGKRADTHVKPNVRTLLQNVKVFAVNQALKPSFPFVRAETDVVTLTLLVTPEQGQQLTLATEVGKVGLMLRSPEDDEIDDASSAIVEWADDEHGTAEGDYLAHVAVDLGHFSITSHHPVLGTSVRVDFHLFGMVQSRHEKELLALLKDCRHRVRDAILVTTREVEIEEPTDAETVIKREILQKANSILGKPLLQAVVLSGFSPAGQGPADPRPPADNTTLEMILMPPKTSSSSGNSHSQVVALNVPPETRPPALFPGDRVHVMFVRKDGSRENASPSERLLLRDVRVFAVNDTDVSLMVTSDRAEVLNLAAELGAIRLIAAPLSQKEPE